MDRARTAVEFEPGNYMTDAAAERDAGAVAQPQGEDGRVGSVDVTAQAPWGWGLAPAASGGPVERALHDLEVTQVGFSQREQNAVRRDVGGRLPNYTEYEPEPYAGGSHPPLRG